MRELSNELSERITPEEVEVAVNNAVHELETELRKTLKRAESMKLELEANENLLKQLQQEWNAERASLCKELANVKRKLTELQMEHAEDRARFIEAADKVCRYTFHRSRYCYKLLLTMVTILTDCAFFR